MVASWSRALLISLLVVGPVRAQSTGALLEKGIYAQETAGNLDDAIRIYRQVVATASSPRATAAQAQARLVQSLLQKGDRPAARQELEHLTHSFAEFRDLSAPLVAAFDPQAASGQALTQPTTTQIETAIRGQVTDDRGRPLRAAEVRLSRPRGGPPVQVVRTDDQGRYELTGLPTNRYNLTVSRSGYLPLQYGQQRPGELGKPLDFVSGQVLEGVNFKLPKMGVISGRISDETRQPIADVMIFALARTYFDGRHDFAIANNGLVRTDADGEYRLGGLAPGSYLVMAVASAKWSLDDAGHEQMGYMPTYFPGTAAMSSAREVTLSVGEEASQTDVQLIPGRAARVSGTAVDSHGRPFLQVALGQEFRGENFGLFTGGPGLSASVGADGHFTIANVPPGHYKLQAATYGDAPEVGILPIDVAGSDIENVALMGSTGGFVTGRLVTDSGPLPKLDDVRIILAPRTLGQPEPVKMGAFYGPDGFGGATIASDGTFKINHVFGPARFLVTVPEGWFVQRVMHGGRDIMATPLDLKSGEQIADVEILITRRITVLTGRVVDQRGAATSDGTVVVFSADRDTWTEGTRFIRAVRPNREGKFEARGLPPGSYLVTAIDHAERQSWLDPEYLALLQPGARAVVLREGVLQTSDLTLVPDRRIR